MPARDATAPDPLSTAPGPVGAGDASAWRRLAWLALVLAAVYFSVHGVCRAIGYDQDLNVGYAAGRVWLAGGNPYDPAALEGELIDQGVAGDAQASSLSWRLNVYVPVTLPLFVPVALLPWTAAKLLLIAANVVAVLLVVWGLRRMLRWRWNDTRALWLLAFVLALSPVHGTVATGQTGLLALLAVVGAALAEGRTHHASAGGGYGVATALKVQMGLPFVGYVLWRRRWPALMVAAGVLAALTAISVGRMEVAGVDWLATWRDNLALTSGTGGINSPDTTNPDRFALVNLQYILAAVIDDRLVVELLTFGLVGIGAMVLVSRIRGRYPARELLALSVVGVLCLLITYHRYYDAVLLALPIAWAIAALGTNLRFHGITVLLLSATFLVPFQTAMVAFAEAGLAPDWITASPLWSVGLLALHVWALILMATVLLSAAGRPPAAFERTAIAGEPPPGA
jgi:Glycosyltransferase family 87